MSLIRWSYEALCINEFSGMTLKPKSANGMLSASTGEQVLESLGCAPSTGSSVVRALKYQAAIIAANYVLTLVSLLWQKPSFEKISDSVPPPLHIPSNKSTATTDSDDVVNGSSSTTKSQSIIATMKPPPVF